MRIGIDISPLRTGHYLQHRVRGSGVYVEGLKRALEKYFSEHQYIFFTRGEKIPKDLDVIHIPYFEPFFLTLPWQKEHKRVVTVHDVTPLVFKEAFPVGMKGSIKWMLQKYNLKRSDAIITDSASSKSDIVKIVGFPASRTYSIFLAADPFYRKILISDTKKKEMRGKYSLPEKFVLYVGDATWNKNLPRLLKAMKSLGIPFIMVGKALVSKDFDPTNPWNKDLAMIEQIAKDDTIIRRLGFVPTDDLVVLYNLATVFVMPSLYEGFGLPILEAMSCGCPVITTTQGSLKEVADDAAFFVDAFDEEAIAKGIKEVFFSYKLQEELRKKGLERAETFSWEKTAKQTITVYEEVVGKRIYD